MNKQSASWTTQHHIEHLQNVQRRSQALIAELEQRDHLSLEELNRLDAEHTLRRARAVLIWYLQGDAARLRIYSDWPTFLIGLYREHTSVH